MSKFNTVRLGDVATYINGYAFKPSDWSDSGLPIIRIQNLTGNDYETNYYSGDYDKKYEIVKGDILISWSASLGIYKWEKEKALLNQHIFKVCFDKLDVDKSYFVHTVSYLLNDMAQETHGSTMKHITKPRFDNTLFPFPPLKIQQQIAENLDKVTHLIDLCNTILEKLDLLVKSRFTEMFGTDKYETVKLKTVCSKITDGTHKTPNYLSKGITFISAKNIVNNELNFFDVKHISEDEYDEIQKRCQTEIYDILLSKSGSLGNPVILKTNERLGLFESLAVIKYDRTKLLPEFLCEQLKTEEVQRQFKTGTKGVAIKHLHLNVIGDTNIIVPSLELQTQFAEFVQSVDKSKLAVKQVLEKAETLKKSLMQEYFG